MEDNKFEIGVPLISEWCKELFDNYNVSVTCMYEGCGSDDGWPKKDSM